MTELNLPTSAVYTLDLAFALPAIVVAGIWLLRRDRRGAPAALAALCWVVLLGLSILAIFGFDAAAGVAVDPAPVLIFGVITAVAAVLTGRGFMGGPAEVGAGGHPEGDR